MNQSIHLAKISIVILMILSIGSCQDVNVDELDATIVDIDTDTFQTISGRVEKGSFVKGSILFINELDSTLAQSGRSFNTLIKDNLGSFELKVKNLKGKFCRVLADGFFYHEVLNRNSTSRIALTGLVKIDSGEIINVNILTHLERPRVEYLLLQGIPYDSAKEQALTEVLNAFGITNPGISRSEKVTLIGPNEENNILLALSTLIVGFRTESEITELLTDIAQDLEKNGTLDNTDLGNDLETHLFYMDTSKVIDQIKSNYEESFSEEVLEGLNFKYIKTFQDNTEFEKDKDLIEYPKFGESGGPNILNSSVTSVSTTSGSPDMACVVSEGITIRIKLIYSDGSDFEFLSYNVGTNNNWIISDKPNGFLKPTFLSSTSGLHSITLVGIKKDITISFYENNGTTPTKVKTVSVK